MSQTQLREARRRVEGLAVLAAVVGYGLAAVLAVLGVFGGGQSLLGGVVAAAVVVLVVRLGTAYHRLAVATALAVDSLLAEPAAD
ncbi:hypothetical protein CLV35_2243 [Motilibacter peucedani]|uniref:Uncharacterized protein n=1 Tax=Motilibacter peucedani TaxID=598650 RepID=A0A420XNK7_9ACTN|nr:hypothetical protein [Motilibacter peucedani]RKS73752.1 hypothetical protein CLV35_2243 [Motilibacter peucedani]